MTTELALGKVAFESVFHLFYGRIISRAIGLAGGLAVVRLLLPEQYGLITIALVLPGFVGLFSDLGINSSVSKYSSELLSRSQKWELRNVVFTAIWFKVSVGLGLALISFSLADLFASAVLGNPQLSILLKVSSWMILGRAMYEVSESVLVATGRAAKYAALMLSFETLAAALPVLFILGGFGVFGVLLGGTMALGTGGIVGAILAIRLLPRPDNQEKPRLDALGQLRRMLALGLPLAGASLMSGMLLQYYSLLIATNLPSEQIGYFTAASQLAALVSYVNIPIVTVLLPTFSRIDGERFPEILAGAYKYAVKYSSLVVLPTAAVMIAGAPFFTLLFFGEAYAASSIYLSLLAAEWLAYGLGWPHLRRLFTAQGRTTLVAGFDLLTMIVGAGTAFLLIRPLGAYAVIVPILTASFPAIIIGTREAQRKHGVPSGIHVTGRLYGSTLAAIMAGFAVALLPFGYLINLALVTVTVGSVYFLSAILLEGITSEDVTILRDLMKGQPTVSKLSRKPLDFLERLAKIRSEVGRKG